MMYKDNSRAFLPRIVLSQFPFQFCCEPNILLWYYYYYRTGAQCTLVQRAVLQSHVVHPSVRPSVCLSVMLVDCDMH